MIYLKLHGMPCNNRCRHCYYHGGAQSPMMSFETIELILEQAVSLKEQFAHVVIQFFDEPTLHPNFLEVYEKQAELELMWPGFFIPTNGTGLANLDDSGWRRLQALGNIEFQFTFYGMPETHDQFAGRQGAFKDLKCAIEQTEKHNISWYGGLVAHAEIANSISKVKDSILTHIGSAGPIGWFIPGWQGRGVDETLRPRQSSFDALKLNSNVFKSEAELIKTIQSTPELATQTAFDTLCQFVSLEIQPDLSVYYGGGCDYAPPAELLPHLHLGSLNDATFETFVERYRTQPPDIFTALKGVTWSELADTFGDPHGDMIFMINDLVANKWVGEYLRKISESKILPPFSHWFSLPSPLRQ